MTIDSTLRSIWPARPTLRLLREDLDADWTNQNDERIVRNGALPEEDLHQLGHPLVTHGAQTFVPSTPTIKRERISVAAPFGIFWKVKTGRWRGAAWEDPETGQAWLVAGGLRREDEGNDFYDQFVGSLQSYGVKHFLPGYDDLTRLRLEQARVDVRLLERDVVLAVLECIYEARNGAPAEREIRSRTGNTLGRVKVELETCETTWDIEDAAGRPAEVALQLVIEDWSNKSELKIVQYAACSTISPWEDDWDIAPTALGCRLLATIDEARLLQLLAASEISDIWLPSAQDVVIHPIRLAHYTSKEKLTDATVMGEAVVALCGQPFVPRQDTDGLPVCDDCNSIKETRALAAQT